MQVFAHDYMQELSDGYEKIRSRYISFHLLSIRTLLEENGRIKRALIVRCCIMNFSRKTRLLSL